MRQCEGFKWFICIITATCLWALTALHAQVISSPPGDIADSTFKNNNQLKPGGHAFTRSAGTLLLCEFTPLVVDRYMRHMDYANISFQTIGDNMKLQSWTWDDDGFTTNQFGHPYHGSTFYNSFRSNGYNFWQSSLATFTGSYLWETVAENQAPAPNDFINTGFGGSILGEMTHRFANKIINNHARGFKRQLSEITAFIINPVNGFTRITTGQWGKVLPGAQARDTTPVYAEFDLGLRQISAEGNKQSSGAYAHVKLIYGSAFSNYTTPFSHIFINAEFGKDDSSKLNILSVYGSLGGWQTPKMVARNQLLLLTANYDYINNSAFFYSAESIKLNWYSKLLSSKEIAINVIAGAGPVLLAAVPDKYGYEDRHYDYCSGVGLHGVIHAEAFNRLFFTVSYRGGWLKTINGIGSSCRLTAVTAEIGTRVLRNFAICAESGIFTLHCNYPEYESISSSYPYLRLSIRYSIITK